MSVCVLYVVSFFRFISLWLWKEQVHRRESSFFSRFDDPIVRKDMYFPYGGNVKIVLFSNHKKRDKSESNNKND